MAEQSLDTLVARVVDTGNCSGCGTCALIDRGLEMRLSADGFMRPVRERPGTAPAGAARRFATACPGMTVRGQHHDGIPYHPVLGPVAGAWEASATDPEIRRRGSSGGVLTALSAWLVESGEVAQVVGAARAQDEPRRTVPVRIVSRAEALGSAGSRYAPVAVCAQEGSSDPAGATVGKPCEISALRALADHDGTTAPLLMSFFCAGTPSQHATQDLLTELGVPAAEPLSDLWYRGRGWPGRFTARTEQGRQADTSYDESWGAALGPTVQWRCKICPDGLGESSDLTAGDFWRSDERGYPLFTESDGFSALVARTERGLDVVQRAVAAGVLTVRPITADDVVAVQPSQRRRRRTLLGRLTGARAAGARIPRYSRFGLLPLGAHHARESLRTARGTFRRVRARRTPRP
ncbi:Coenzyme F420 hydrogenase/dehydrogenase, beta subunit C-terminal domain [Cellulomonas sp. ATA003]|uniref:Coenzyme F420 hydrogenase/dehydrogenase, beta subunit C-terminal domain n=1 Tax=Cellulomonas sp. ATA003 TaxID=3073064 RepID=UPI002873C87F|nr:Coenzyme F420 hydrogenase/dehydrogenase, beta subunit C-terminal domain [Cellulomonas sp. ATA003]WNB85082.1 Coenzyme F420 hydrogenase/dehydrogenase, beta subunit C-terminal domain [Cellulomonas sp. ATA003]